MRRRQLELVGLGREEAASQADEVKKGHREEEGLKGLACASRILRGWMATRITKRCWLG